MNFENKLIPGLFIKRYKRFFVDVKVGNKIVTAHCPNTGSMQGLLNRNNSVLISKSTNPNRKLKAGKKNYKIFIIYLIQRDDCDSFAIAKDIDPNYANALSKAVKNNLNILCYDCKFSSKGIKLNNKIKFIK